MDFLPLTTSELIQMRNVYTVLIFIVCFVSIYIAIFVPCVSKYKTTPVKKSEYCRGNYFVQCVSTFYYDLPKFCILQTDNGTLALVNATHAQIGDKVYGTNGRLKASSFSGYIIDGTSVLSEQQRCPGH